MYVNTHLQNHWVQDNSFCTDYCLSTLFSERKKNNISKQIYEDPYSATSFILKISQDAYYGSQIIRVIAPKITCDISSYKGILIQPA